jgi:hypothetical protein
METLEVAYKQRILHLPMVLASLQSGSSKGEIVIFDH